MDEPAPAKRRGRPRAEDAPVAREQILAAALRAFATHGYDGVSVRTLNRELGVSHNLLNQRFGSKEELWYAAVDWGFGNLVADLGAIPASDDPFEQMRRVIRRFLEHSATHPELFALMSIEGRQDTPRLDYIFDTYVAPATAPLGQLLDVLAARGEIRPIPVRELFFLLAHGAAAPFTLVPFARRFDAGDPLDHVDAVTDLLIAGLRIS